MRKFVITVIGAMAVCASSAQYNGRVVDNSEMPVFGVNVVIGDDQQFSVITDHEGRFTFKGKPGSPARMRTASIGHVPLDTVIVITKDDTQDHVFRLRPDVTVMRAAEVTALRAGDAPFPRSTLNKETIIRTNTGVDLPYLLDLQPSVVVTSDAGTGIGYTGMRIRGTDATRTNITLNGVPFNDPESQGAFLVNLPDLASSAEDIEVQRGVGTSTNGPAAFGATVNLRTNSVKRDPWGSVGASGGSFNTRRFNIMAGTGLVQQRFSLDVRLSSVASDGYIDRATSDLKSYFLQGAWTGRKRSLRFITFRGKEITYQAWAGVPRELIDTDRTYNEYTYKNEVDNYDQTHYQVLYEEKLGKSTTLNITGFRVDGKGYYENYKAEVAGAAYFPSPIVIGSDTVQSNDFIIRRWLDNSMNGINASIVHGFGAHKLVVGGSYSDYGGSHFGEVIWARTMGAYPIGQRYYDNNARKTDMNAFAKLSYAMCERIVLFGDAQVRKVNHELLGYNNTGESVEQLSAFTFFNPKGGVTWHIHKGGRLYASAAIANREPNREDLMETTPTSRPNSERLMDYELGYERRSNRSMVGANFYYMDYTDQLVLTGELNDVGAALRTNVPKSFRTGVELTYALQLTSRVTWKGSATFSRNRIRNFTEYVDDWDSGDQQRYFRGSAPIAFSPDLIVGNELAFRFWKNMEKGYADITLVTKYVGQQYLDNSGSSDRSLDAYLVNDIRLNVAINKRKGTPQIDINLTVRNIFNELYSSNGWSYSYVLDGRRQELVGLYPQAPMNILGGIQFGF